MALFRRRRRQGADPTAPGTADAEPASPEGGSPGEATTHAEPVLGEHTAADLGPFDVADVPSTVGFVDLGSILLPGIAGLSISVEVDEASGVVTAARIPVASSALQLQAFAAPRSTGLWPAIRAEIAEGITDGGGTAQEAEGPYGAELLVRVPGGPGREPVPMRFLGVDGPRWFLRGVLSGPAATDPELAQPFIDLMRLVTVVRGDAPMAPRELLPLRIPDQPQTPPAADDAGTDATQGPRSADDMRPFERGPEITEVR